jgi:uncharacterized protein (TIGR02246 family)
LPVRSDSVQSIMVAIALVCMAAISGAQAEADEGRSPDPEAVHSLWSAIDSMWNAGDPVRFSELFTEDASFEFVDRGDRLENRADILERFAEQFRQRAPDLRHSTSLREVHAITPEVLAADGTVEILRVASGADAEPLVLMTYALFTVMLQDAGDLKIRTLRVYRLPSES